MQMIRLLSSILNHYESGGGGGNKESFVEAPAPESGLYYNNYDVLSHKHSIDLYSIEDVVPEMTAVPPSREPLLPPTSVPTTLKEGVVEKKGHSVAFLMWPE